MTNHFGGIVWLLFLFLAVVSYLTLGLAWGAWSRIVYKEDREGLWALILFPIDVSLDLRGGRFSAPVSKIKTRAGWIFYQVAMALFWPARLLWNLCGIAVFIVVCLVTLWFISWLNSGVGDQQSDPGNLLGRLYE